jgi:hypothetical protein
MILGAALMVSSVGLAPAALEGPRPTIVPVTFTYTLPEPAAPSPLRNALAAPGPLWDRAPFQPAPAPAKRFSTTERIVITAVSALAGFYGGGLVGYAVAQDDKDDDGTSGLPGVMIGAPIGAAAGAIVAWKLTK